MIPLLLLASELVWASCVLLALTTPAAAQTLDPAPVAAMSHATEHRRPAWEERFARANTTRDGRLTLEQARMGYKSVARHFDQIDRGAKGYVTEHDVRAWQEATREKRRAQKREGEDPLRPRKAYQRTQGDQASAVTTQVIGPHVSGRADDPDKPAE